MQPRPIAETIGPPRPSFRCFILVEIRLSSSSRLRNRQATVPQNFSIRRCADDERRASKHVTFVAENLLQSAAHRLYRRAPRDRDDGGVRESDGCVRYVTGIQSGWPVLPSERRDIRFSPRVHVTKPRSFVADAPDGVQFFHRLRLTVCAVSR